MIEKFCKKAKRVVSALLVYCMVFSMLTPAMAETVANDDASGEEEATIVSESANLPTIKVEWGDGEFTDGDSLNVVEYDDVTNVVKLKVSYSQKQVVEDGYSAGELVITVKGIGAVGRSATIAALVGADAQSSSVKQRDWSYSWNKATDTYTFINNYDIKANSVFSGYFEMIWKLPSRDCITDYSQDDVQATMIVPSGESVDSNTLTFTNKTYCDGYENLITVDNTRTLYNTDSLRNYVNGNPQDYVWVCYDLRYWMSLRQSRGINGSITSVFNPDADGVGSGAVVIPALSNISVTTRTKETSGIPEGKGTYNVGLENSYISYVYVAYPRSSYEGKTVRATLNEYGAFYEYDDNKVVGNVLLASNDVEVLIEGELPDPPSGAGATYSFSKTPSDQAVSGVKYGTSFTVTHTLTANFVTSGLNEYVIGDDTVTGLTVGNTTRQLNSDEYVFTKITIPSTTSFGVSKLSDYKFAYDVYAVQDGETLVQDEDHLVLSGTLSATEKTVQLPASTTGFCVVLHNVNKDFKFSVGVTTKITPSEAYGDDALDIENGRVINTAFSQVYDVDTATGELSLSESETSKAVVRFKKPTTIVHTSYVTSNTLLGDIAYSARRYTVDYRFGATFDFYNDDYPTQFSLYTIVPDYLTISGVKNVEDLMAEMTLSGMGLDETTLKKHCTAELIRNYQGTGSTYVALHFDFDGVDVPQSTSIYASFATVLSSVYYQNNTGSITAKSCVILDNENLQNGNIAYVYSATDNGEWYLDQASCDIDGDKDTTEKIAYSSSSKSWMYVASSQWQMNKSVKTEYTDGNYVNTPLEDDEYIDVEYGGEYSYLLSVTSGNNVLADLIIYDSLETGENAQWQGILQSVDVSALTKIGLSPVVYYSTNANAIHDLTSGDWSTDLSPEKAKSIAIDLSSSEIPANTSVNVYLNMVAPTSRLLKNKITENGYTATGTMIDLTTGFETIMDDTLESNMVQTRLVAPQRTVYVTKTDAVSGENLSDATFTLYKKIATGQKGSIVATATTDDDGLAKLRHVPEDAEYILEETSAPYGYTAADDRVVAVDEDNVYVTVADERIGGTIAITKKSDLDSRVLLEGATFTLYDDEGVAVSTATSNSDGVATFTNVPWGDFTIKETESPVGYELSDEVLTGTVSRENFTETQTFTFTDEQSPATVKVIKKAETADGVQTDDTLRNATFELSRKINNSYSQVGLYVTDKNGEIYVSELPYGEYQLREYKAPAGYELSETVTFTLSADEPDAVVMVYDKQKMGSLVATKTSDLGDFVSGAVYALYASDKTTLIGEYTTDEAGVFSVSNLAWGTYWLKEISAPEGYEIDQTMRSFTISASRLNVAVSLTDETIKGSVVLTKTDESGMNKLAGAVYSLYTSAGVLVQNGLTTDENGTIQVNDLAWGSYYFLENTAPTGYGVSDEKIRFSVNYRNASVVQELTATDPQESRVIYITKKIQADEVNFDNGTPSFIFYISGVDVNGVSHEYYRMVTLDENSVDDDGFITQTVSVSGFVAGTYTVTEESSARFYLKEVSEYGNGVLNDDSSVTFDMIDAESVSVTFTNSVYEHQNYSDTNAVTNVVAPQAQITKFTVENTAGENVKADTAVDRDKLIVAVYFDDGTSRILANDEYELSDETYPNQNGSYTITVTYTSGKIVKTGTFNVTLYGMVERVVSLSAVANDKVYTNTDLTYDMFTVTATYNTGKVTTLGRGDYIISPTNSGNVDGTVTCTISLNTDTFTDEKEQDVSCTADLTVMAPPAYLASTSDFWTYLSKKLGVSSASTLKNKATSIVFSQDTAPENTTVVDVSYNQDGSVVAWITDKVLYISSQSSSQKVKLLDDYSAQLFYWCDGVTSIDTTLLDVSEATNLEGFFMYCRTLQTIIGLENWDVSSVTNMNEMFKLCPKLSDMSGLANWDTSSVTNMSDTFANCSLLNNLSFLETWDVSNVTDMSHMFYALTVTSVDGLENWDTSSVTNMNGIFSVSQSLSNIDALSNWDTSAVTDMSQAFTNCSWIENVDALASWDTSSVTDMSSMFYGCTSLTNIDGLTDWDTNAVTTMNGMFNDSGYGLKITNVDALAKWNTSSVTDMGSMFAGCYLLESVDGLANWDTSSVTNMRYMFAGFRCIALALSDISGLANWDVSSVENMEYLFSYCEALEDVDALLDWDTSSVTNIDRIFYDCKSLKNVDGCYNWDVSHVPEINGIFYNCTSLQNVNGFANWEIGQITDLSSMFSGCSSLSNIDGLAKWDTSNVTNMSKLFYQCTALENVDALANWDTSAVTDMTYMFDSCKTLENADDLVNWNTEKVTDMSYMFSACWSLSHIDFSMWDTHNVTEMDDMFSGCSSLESIDGVANWNTSKVTSMSYMFSGCSSLESIDGVANWNTSKVSYLGSMFAGCRLLESVDGLANWDTSNVTYLSSIFDGCTSLENIDAVTATWNVDKVTSMSYMFRNCSSLTSLDLSNWSSSSLGSSGASQMFYGCSSLQTIYTSESFDLSTKTSSTNVFTDCYYLVGGLGTSYSSSQVNYAYGHLDSVSNPGYFTYYLPITGITATVAENAEITDDAELTPEAFDVSIVYEGGLSTSVSVGTVALEQVGDSETATSPNWPSNYSNNLTEANTAQEFTFDGAEYITVEFDSTSKLESARYDWVSVYDTDGTNYGGSSVLGGTAIAGTTLTIPGNYVKIAMRSDGSSTYKGYSATITAYGTAGYSSYNYTVERSTDADGNPIAIITLDPDYCGTAYQTTVALS